MTTTEQLTIRRADPEDLPAIIEVCGTALEWSDVDVDAAFFRWKHVENPFGRSPIWVAEDTVDGTTSIVGVRAMMRWRLESPTEGALTLTRAVDTATLPSHQGRGIFRRSTLAALDELEQDRVDAVFNTPNDKSRPGYLKMGWETVGRVSVTVRPRSPRSLLTMARSKVAAEKWGQETEVGISPAEAFGDREAIERALEADEVFPQWSTPLSVDYLRWRTSFEPLHCRFAPLGRTLADGFVVFRLRRRGELRQLSLLHVVGSPDRSTLRRTIGRLMADTDADVALASGRRIGPAHLLLPLPSAGPLLTWRPLATPATPPLEELELPLGTIELF